MTDVAAVAVEPAATIATPAVIEGSLQQPLTLSSNTTLPRLERTTVCLPIVHGSVAFYLGKKADEFQSHQWTLYLRGPHNEDLSPCIQKVVFQLHASFAQPIREFTVPPYEVTEKGWGEFEAQIRIHWKDPTENMTMVTHGIKLYPPGTPAVAAAAHTEIPVVAETYDEVVFTDPNEDFFRHLLAVREAPTVETEYSQYQHFTKFSDTDDVHALLEAQKFLSHQLRDAKERLKTVDEDLVEVEEDLLACLEQQQQQRTPTAPNHATATSAGSKSSLKIINNNNKHKIATSADNGSAVSKNSLTGKKSKLK